MAKVKMACSPPVHHKPLFYTSKDQLCMAGGEWKGKGEEWSYLLSSIILV